MAITGTDRTCGEANDNGKSSFEGAANGSYQAIGRERMHVPRSPRFDQTIQKHNGDCFGMDL